MGIIGVFFLLIRLYFQILKTVWVFWGFFAKGFVIIQLGILLSFVFFFLYTVSIFLFFVLYFSFSVSVSDFFYSFFWGFVV